jgi:hypothetical protein
MTYIDSLDLLAAACRTRHRIHPAAHGVLGFAPQATRT